MHVDCHFAETEPALDFDCAATRGSWQDMAAETAVRFEPGQVGRVRLVPRSGDRRVFGFNAQMNGDV